MLIVIHGLPQNSSCCCPEKYPSSPAYSLHYITTLTGSPREL